MRKGKEIVQILDGDDSERGQLRYQVVKYDGLTKEKLALKPGQVFFGHSNLIHHGGSSSKDSKAIGIVKTKKGNKKNTISPQNVTHMSVHTYVGKNEQLHFDDNELITIPVEFDETKLS